MSGYGMVRRDEGGVKRGNFISCDDAEAVVVVPGHIVDQIDLPSQVFAHRAFAILAAMQNLAFRHPFSDSASRGRL